MYGAETAHFCSTLQSSSKRCKLPYHDAIKSAPTIKATPTFRMTLVTPFLALMTKMTDNEDDAVGSTVDPADQ